MKKFCVRALGSVVLLLGLILVLVLVEHFRGEIALNARLKRLAANGEKLDYKDLLPPKPSVEENAALDLFALTNDLRRFFNLYKSAPPVLTFVLPGRTTPAWQRNTWEVDKNTSNSWDKFGPELDTAGPELDRLKSIWGKTGFDDGFDYAKGLVDFNSPSLLIFSKETSMLLSEAVGYDLKRGDLTAAQNHLRSLLAVISALGKEHLVISQLVDEACENFAFNTTCSALQHPGWTEAQLAELQAAWETANDFPLAMAKSCEMERALTLDYFRQIRRSQSLALNELALEYSLPDFLGGDSDKSSAQNLPLRRINLFVWRGAWAAQDELRSLDRWESVVKGGKIAASNSWAEARGFFSADELIPSFLGSGISISKKSLGWYDRSRFLFSSSPFSVNGSTILRPLEVETEKNLAITAIALKRYELHHGNAAAELRDLVPEFLAAVPIDRMDGKPLRYHLNPDGSFSLYSVGLNGVDDGGNPEPEKPSERFGNIWNGKDAVWPVVVKN